MPSVEEFIASPSEELLDLCTKEQLLKIAEHYNVDISGNMLKERQKAILTSNLVENGILAGRPSVSLPLFPKSTSSFTFEQQKELLMIQIEHEKFKMKVEMDKALAVEKIRQETIQAKFDFENRLEEKETAPLQSAAARTGASAQSTFVDRGFDVIGNLRLVPKFCEKDPDSFFVLFERIADACSWPVAARALMLQTVLTGKAQEAYSSLTLEESQDYTKVKTSVLKAYERVPEFYRQQFRTWKKSEKQSHLEFARDLQMHFSRWCSAAEVNDFNGLCDIIVLEQYKDSVPSRVAVYVSEQKAQTATEAAMLADDYVLMHKHIFNQYKDQSIYMPSSNVFDSVARQGKGFQSENKSNGPRDVDRVCQYCHRRGHWKSDCYMLKFKPKSVAGASAKGTGLAAPVRSVDVSASVQIKNSGSTVLETYQPFVRTGFVSLIGSDTKVPVKILRDTGAFDSFILADVLPFSRESELGRVVPVRGMGLSVLHVPLHKVMLDCDLFQGEAALAVRPALPIEGVTVILGNKLAASWSLSNREIPLCLSCFSRLNPVLR